MLYGFPMPGQLASFTNEFMTRLTSHDVTITLDAHAWGLLSCLLSVHNQRPVMSSYDTAELEKIRIELNGALESDVHAHDLAACENSACSA